ncbi:hypothetical protein M406DRAFT_346418 [Cryphonectria parasitica EP155]|uniref:Zn(2)-C6 fungal-type domain-containing protein n=1 Tax=Cryphonectria parasitica (strain ATCC 38755 / EP155) TaxID=660469 RepID=A0A9P5CNM8_CRYP1|nr:uncharacterized protein M406DRAFT_346418 [Cryphonectria parasitica EP155]KAF3764090.1 hypothetical protein M406DRAFT_346418 [Cryphonectria parasitica EP155]
MTASPQDVSARAPALKKRACDSCYRRKIHCDGANPHCNWCSHHGIACTYARPLKLRKPRASNRKRSSRNQSAHGGSFAGSTSSHIDPPSSSASSPDPSAAASFGKLHFAGYQLGDINSFQGIPLFSSDGRRWIQERTGSKPAFPSLVAPLWQNEQHIANQVAIAPISGLALPARKVVDAYFQLFKSTTLNLVFPVVHIASFQETIDLAYSQPQPTESIEVLDAQACVFSFISVIHFFEGSIEDAPVDPELCVAKAQQLLPRILLQSTVTSLQVALMLGIYQMLSGHTQLASIHISCACRLVYMLGAHVLRPIRTDGRGRDNYRAQNHLRRLFWLCYTFDKDISLRTGQPPCLEDDYCDISLPDNYDDIITARWDADPMSIDDSEISALFVPGNLKLSLIKAKAGKLLYSARSLQKSDAELLRDVRELDDELENWRISVNKDWRPSLIQSGGATTTPSDMTQSKTMDAILSHFEYYYLMATIHRATSRCKAWADVEGGDMDGVGSSLELTVQASRSTLFYLRAAVHSLLGQSFWMVLFYPMTAILTIFCNILLKPRDPQAQDDLDLLKTAPELIKKMRTRRLTLKEFIHMKLVEDFIMELIRLGDCAIQKAR